MIEPSTQGYKQVGMIQLRLTDTEIFLVVMMVLQTKAGSTKRSDRPLLVTSTLQ